MVPLIRKEEELLQKIHTHDPRDYLSLANPRSAMPRGSKVLVQIRGSDHRFVSMQSKAFTIHNTSIMEAHDYMFLLFRELSKAVRRGSNMVSIRFFVHPDDQQLQRPEAIMNQEEFAYGMERV